MRVTMALLLVLASLALSSCADFYSISRRTSLPKPPSPSSTSHGIAIHLDAQQRLVIYGADGKYCAEASPDAMAAYAAALAASASAQGYGAGSLSQASQSNLASIGLRTQSITLMRDALYRLCEATANKTVSPISATQLLARSQDLTAVVVAVEQLTGAVAANQAILTGSSNSEASASLISDAALLDTARKNQVRKEEELTQAKAARTAQQGAVNAQQAKVTAAERSLDDAKQVVDTIENKNSAAMTQTAAGTTGSGQFSPVVPRVQLDKEATEQVAKSVEVMVTTVLNKVYTIDACMTMLTNVTEFKELNQDQRDGLRTTIRQCTILLNAKINAETNKLLVESYESPGPDAQRIKKAMAVDSTLLDRLSTWLAQRGDITPADLLYGSRYADLRRQVITVFRIP